MSISPHLYVSCSSRTALCAVCWICQSNCQMQKEQSHCLLAAQLHGHSQLKNMLGHREYTTTPLTADINPVHIRTYTHTRTHMHTHAHTCIYASFWRSNLPRTKQYIIWQMSSNAFESIREVYSPHVAHIPFTLHSCSERESRFNLCNYTVSK